MFDSPFDIDYYIESIKFNIDNYRKGIPNCMDVLPILFGLSAKLVADTGLLTVFKISTPAGSIVIITYKDKSLPPFIYQFKE